VFVSPRPGDRNATAPATCSIPPDSALAMDNMLIRHGVASGKFLEIGFAGGMPTLASMSRFNWAITGIGIDDAPELFQAASFSENSFDVVYVGNGVIAHVASPRKLLADARRILRPRGLLVLRTPNARSGFAMLTLAAARVAHGAWVHSQAPHHLHEFTRRSLRTMLETLGYEVAWNRATTSSGLLAAPRAKTALERLALMPVRTMGAVLDFLSRGGSELFVGARKPPLHYGARTS
jgi:SAM-dependent methyltransferase